MTGAALGHMESAIVFRALWVERATVDPATRNAERLPLMYSDQKPPVILVVDDNQEIREALCDFLVLEGFAVRTAVDGASALQDLQSNGRPDLVLLDLRMPGMDGYEFLRRQSMDVNVQNLPVMVVTANAVERSIPYPVAGVFCKPVDLDLLLGAIRREVDRSTRGSSARVVPMRH